MTPFAKVHRHVMQEAAKRGLSDRGFRLLVAILTFASPTRPVAFPSRETLAETCGMSLATLKRALADLRASGIVEIGTRRNAEGWPVNTYDCARLFSAPEAVVEEAVPAQEKVEEPAPVAEVVEEQPAPEVEFVDDLGPILVSFEGDPTAEDITRDLARKTHAGESEEASGPSTYGESLADAFGYNKPVALSAYSESLIRQAEREEQEERDRARRSRGWGTPRGERGAA